MDLFLELVADQTIYIIVLAFVEVTKKAFIKDPVLRDKVLPVLAVLYGAVIMCVFAGFGGIQIIAGAMIGMMTTGVVSVVSDLAKKVGSK